jgi:CDP-diacylglycerol---serine O-phosphatidyltransferase
VRVGPSSPVIALKHEQHPPFLDSSERNNERAGLAAGFLAMLAVIDAQIWRATIWVIVAAVLDSLDGAVARGRSDDHAFGTNLDSLADMVSFGVVPAIALYLGPLHAMPILGLGASLVFLLGAAWRLARFPLVKRCDCFLGMPMPVAGVLLMVFLLWRPAPELALIITGRHQRIVGQHIAVPDAADDLPRHQEHTTWSFARTVSKGFALPVRTVALVRMRH